MSLKMNRESMVLAKKRGQPVAFDKTSIKTYWLLVRWLESNYAISRYGPSHNPVTSVLMVLKNMLVQQCQSNYAKGCDMIDATWPESEIIETPLTPPSRQVSIRQLRRPNNQMWLLLLLARMWIG
jgi:beta-glucosidase